MGSEFLRNTGASGSRIAIKLCFVASLAYSLGCSQNLETKDPTSHIPKLESEFREGPLRIHVQAYPSKITMVDPVKLVLETQMEPGWKLEWPQIGEALGPFRVLSQKKFVQKNEAGQQIETLNLELELDPMVPLESKAMIPALTFSFAMLSSDDLPPTKFDTKPLWVEVEKLLGEKIHPDQLRPANSPLSLPRWRIWILCLALGALILGLFLILWSRRKTLKRNTKSEKSSPYEEALAALKALQTRGYHTKGQTALFLDIMSQIIRRYIEGQFGIHAPERTTEEFLLEAAQSRIFVPHHKKVLSQFLEQADLAKFAKVIPTQKHVLRSFSTAELFLLETQAKPGS